MHTTLYIALLRGINVGGKNKVSMSQLKDCFERLGYTDVFTYINSGNVIFRHHETDKTVLVQQCEAEIEREFGFRVTCSVITASELHDALDHAPTWWGTIADNKHNALFVIAPMTAADAIEQVGPPIAEYEKIASHGPVIFWSAPLVTFSRTRYSKIVGTPLYQKITIRNARTTRRLDELTRT